MLSTCGLIIFVHPTHLAVVLSDFIAQKCLLNGTGGFANEQGDIQTLKIYNAFLLTARKAENFNLWSGVYGCSPSVERLVNYSWLVLCTVA